METLKSGWLTTGHKVKTFEEDFARYVGSKHAVAVNSGTAALHLALDAIGIIEGDEVIVPTMTFTATAEVVLYFKAKPVLVDCQPDTLNLDPAQIEAAITPKTKAIIPVHIAGRPCDMDEHPANRKKTRFESNRGCGSRSAGQLSRRCRRHDWPYHLLFILCDQDHHDGRRRNGHDRES